MRQFFIKVFIWFIVLALAACGLAGWYFYDKISDCKSTCEASVEAWSKHYGLAPELVYAVIYVESGGDIEAVSDAGAMGVMQLMPQTAQWIASKENIRYDHGMLTLKDFNIRLGCAYLAYLSGIYTHTDNILAAYNAGPAKVDAWLKDARYSKDGVVTDPPYGETAGYIKKVNTLVDIYKRLK